MDLRDQAQAMCQLQDTFNQRISKIWRSAGFAWYRAIWLEAAELADRVPWKWWKAAPLVDKIQAQLELVDIWHFILSWALVEEMGVDHLVAILELTNRHELPHRTEIEVVERIAAAAVQQDLGATTTAFATACRLFELNSDLLYRLYIGKNALNVHRNKHGYKEGTYVKIWDGREDNQHLEDIMASGVTDFDSVVAALAQRYSLATAV